MDLFVLRVSIGSIDNTSELGSAVQEGVIGLGEFFEVELFAQGDDVVLSREFQHVSDFLSRSDQRTSVVNVTEDKRSRVELARVSESRETDLNKSTQRLSQTDQGSQVVTGRQGVKDNVVLASFLLEGFFVAEDDSISTELLDEFFLILTGGESSNIASPSFGVLDSHVTKTTDTKDSNAITFLAVSGDGSIKGDTSAEKRGNSFFRKVFWNLEEEIMRVLDGSSITAPIFGAIGEVLVIVSFAELFNVGGAVFALFATSSLATKADQITDLVVLDVRSNVGNSTNNFVTGSKRVTAATPLSSHSVSITVAETSIGNFSSDFVGLNFRELERDFLHVFGINESPSNSIGVFLINKLIGRVSKVGFSHLTLRGFVILNYLFIYN